MERIFSRGLNAYERADLKRLISMEKQNELPPLWKASGNDWFVNAATHLQIKQRPSPLCGGLLIYQKPLNVVPLLLYLIASAIENQPNLPTLELAVTGDIFHWKQEIANYTEGDFLKVLCIHKKEKDATDLRAYHIVLTDHQGASRPDIMDQKWERLIVTHVEYSGRLPELESHARWVAMDKPVERRHLPFLLPVLQLEPFSRNEDYIRFLSDDDFQVLHLPLWFL